MARQRKIPGAAVEMATVEEPAAEAPAAPADLKMDVLVELSRMAAKDAGGSCVLFRKPPEVPPAVHDEVRRLCLAEPGARLTPALPVYCFSRDATAVLSDIVKGLAR